MATAAERKKAAQKRGNKFIKDLYEQYKIGGNVDQIYKDVFDWLNDNQGMNLYDLTLVELADGIEAALDATGDLYSKFFDNAGQKLVQPFLKDKDGRMNWEKSLTSSLSKLKNDFTSKIGNRGTSPDIDDVGEEFFNELETRSFVLKNLINSATEEEYSDGDVVIWQAELEVLTDRMDSKPESVFGEDVDNPGATAKWLAGDSSMDDSLRVTDTFSVRVDKDKDLLESAISNSNEAESADRVLSTKRRDTRIGNPAAVASSGSNVDPSLEGDLRTELLEVRELLLNTTDEKEKTKLLDRYEQIAEQISIPGDELRSVEDDLRARLLEVRELLLKTTDEKQKTELLELYANIAEQISIPEDEFKPTGAAPRLMNDPGAMAARRSESPPLNTIATELSNREKLQLGSGEDPTNDPSGGGGGGGGSGSGRGSSDANTLSPLAMQYVVENFGSVQFFKDPARDKEMWVDSNNDGIKDVNIIDFLQSTEESNPDVIWSLFQTTEWFENNGPAARQFQTDWAKARGTESWQPVFNADALANESMWNMTPDMEELLDDTYDSLILEAERIGIDTNNGDTKTAIMQMAFNAKQLNMSEYELKNEFITNVDLAFDPAAVANSGTFGAITSKLKSNAGQYMIKLSDEAYNVLAQDIYLGKTTYEGQQAVWQQQARDDNPAIASMIDQGYTPSAYFSSYATAASSLLGRPIDLLGDDNNLYQALTDSRFNETTGLQRIMTRGEFERHVRSMPEWDTTESARGEAYSTVGSLLESFGVK